MAASSAFAAPSQFAPSTQLRRSDPASVDWGSIDTIGDAAAAFDRLLLPGVGGGGRPAYDYEALDSGEAEEASTELVRRGLLNPAQRLVVPAAPENPTAEQRRSYEYARERAAYAAGRQLQARRTLDAVHAALGGSAPPKGDMPLYARVEHIAGRPRVENLDDDDDEPDIPVSM
jgi:hypothetical protein